MPAMLFIAAPSTTNTHTKSPSTKQTRSIDPFVIASVVMILCGLMSLACRKFIPQRRKKNRSTAPKLRSAGASERYNVPFVDCFVATKSDGEIVLAISNSIQRIAAGCVSEAFTHIVRIHSKLFSSSSGPVSPSNVHQRPALCRHFNFARQTFFSGVFN